MKKEIKDIYARYGVDVNKALKTLSKTAISLHCWQLDDVAGFENVGELTGGIQTTGNYPGKARNFQELCADLDIALKYIPGKKKINLHACYQSNNVTDRKDITVNNFKSWIDYAKERNLGLDFNPNIFSSPKLVDGLSLSSPDKKVRDYWIEHCINSIKVTEEFCIECPRSIVKDSLD